uniref:AlNc14C237G9407 protein n=1 Tax=Albugo laibachii Nc14 TaxID=890382 RepID=F0WF18_9STRA|nr:AlNc14C79G5212 [Albugo laibachii Nc14]CCA24389.1 AlNc14C237G9407 [Albugo laibachii Nc14]|eukprot:CCA24389.1 AlNc14C237G9407 [Albugo laibachii Nc14]
MLQCWNFCRFVSPNYELTRVLFQLFSEKFIGTRSKRFAQEGSLRNEWELTFASHKVRSKHIIIIKINVSAVASIRRREL